jgi:hypothetical protein
MAQRSWIIRARALQEDGWYTFNGLRQHFFALYGQGCPYAKEVEDDDVLQPEHSEKKGEKGEKGEKRKRDDPRIARMQGRTEAELQDWIQQDNRRLTHIYKLETKIQDYMHKVRLEWHNNVKWDPHCESWMYYHKHSDTTCSKTKMDT